MVEERGWRRGPVALSLQGQRLRRLSLGIVTDAKAVFGTPLSARLRCKPASNLTA
jgi:hypothetical protein